MTLILLGAGGHASDVLAVAEALGIARVALADDGQPDLRRFDDRARFLDGSLEEATRGATDVVCAIGYPEPRSTVVERLQSLGVPWSGPLVHPDASVHRSVQLGIGCVVFGQTWLSPHVRVDAHVHVGYGSTVGHDTVIGQCSTVMPSACVGGDVEVGERVLIGANSTVLEGLRIGSGAVVGAGAVVTTDVEPGSTVVGNPARVTTGER